MSDSLDTSDPLQDAVQALENAREGLRTAVREARASGRRIKDIAEATGYSRQHVHALIGPAKPQPAAAPSREAMESRLEELDSRWSLVVDQMAQVERPPDAYIRRETAKRNGRRGKDERKGLRPRATVLEEARAVGEAKLLEALRRNPDDARVVGLVAELTEAETIRQTLELRYDRILEGNSN